MSKLFSYVVDHDLGFAPNPYGGYCTLAHCKFKQERRNIIEMAEIGHWVAGTGGLGSTSAGHRKLIYGMRVEEKMTLRDYARDERFWCRDDNLAEYCDCTDRFVLISQHYYYFGREAIDISSMPTTHLDHPFEKGGPRYRSDFSDAFIADFENWLRANYPIGMNGIPCGVDPSHTLGSALGLHRSLPSSGFAQCVRQEGELLGGTSNDLVSLGKESARCWDSRQ
jgi:hypothetical protein